MIWLLATRSMTGAQMSRPSILSAPVRPGPTFVALRLGEAERPRHLVESDAIECGTRATWRERSLGCPPRSAVEGDRLIAEVRVR